MPELFALANERTLPVLIHAGRGIPALGEHVIAYAQQYPNARVILAHAAVSDLAWIWRACVDLPNVLFDTAWWISQDLVTLFTLVPPARFSLPPMRPMADPVSAASQLRLALQAGLSPEQVALIASGQSLRIASAEPLAVAGPAIGERDRASHPTTRTRRQLSAGRDDARVPHRRRQRDGRARSARLRGTGGGRRRAGVRCYPEAAKTYEIVRAAEPANRATRSLLHLAAAVAMTPDVPLPA